MLLKPKFQYFSISRETSEAGRQYRCPDGSRVPSVTTILDKTKPEEKKKALLEWRKRVGETEANAITKAAAGRGTSMHKRLEDYIMGQMKEPGSNPVHQQAAKMADLIIKEYLEPNVNEIWGSEVNLYYSGLYAGTTDCPGVWNNNETILDFKQTNKPKKVEWIEDYFLQLAAYGHAHNHIYGTNIKHGVILMCSGDLQLQKFELSGNDFDKYSDIWWRRVEQYYR